MKNSKTIKSVTDRWGGETNDYNVYARARFADGSRVDGRLLYTNSESARTRRAALASLRRALRVVNLPPAAIRAALAAATDEEVL